MANFVTGNIPLPPDKANGSPVPVGAENLYGRAEDFNFLRDAAGDLRDHTRGWVNARSYGLACDGVTDDYPALAAMLTLLGSTPATLVVPGPCLIGTSVTIPATLPVRFEGAGAFTGAGVVTYTRQGGGLAARRTDPDASDLLVYTFDEAVSPWANTGAAGAIGNSLALSGTGTLPITMPGLFESGSTLGNGIDFNAGTTIHVDGAANVEPTGPFTVTTWHLPRTLNATGGVPFFLKGYRPGGPATDPFWSAGLDIDTTGYLRFAFKVTGNPTRIVQIATLGKPIIGAWNYVGVTFSGTGTTQLMLNGKIVATFTGYSATPIDWGTHGTWAVGGTPTGNTGSTVDGLIDEFRVANVVRPASYFAAVWKQGMLL